MNIQREFKKLLLLFSAVLFLGGSMPAIADEDPIIMLQGVTDRVMTELRENRHEIRQNPDRIYAVVERLILPYADFTEMARWVVGRNAWRQMDARAQEEFIKEFKNMVVRSYARSLLEYTDQEIEFLPLREATGNKQRIQILSLIKDRGKLPVHMDYRLIRSGDTWRVYDIIIEGVSLIQGYRAQFSDDIQQNGVDAAIEKMRLHNDNRR